MEKYNIILRNIRNGEPMELTLKDVEGPRVPIKDEKIYSTSLTDYIKTVAIKKDNTKYITNFSRSVFFVSEVEHIPKFSKGKLEATVLVTALKI